MSRQIKNIIAITVFLICIGLINIAGQNIEIEIRGMNAFTFILIIAVLLQVIEELDVTLPKQRHM